MVTHEFEAPEGYDRRPSGLLIPQAVNAKGRYTGRIIRKGEVIDEFECENLIVNQGLNYLLGAALGAQSPITSWYIGLFSGNYTILSTDTATNIAASSTEVTAYTAGVRQTWTPGAASGQSISNSASQASFTFSGNATLYGAFMISSATISGTSGSLFSGAQFGSAKSVVNTDVLQLTYTFNAASA